MYFKKIRNRQLAGQWPENRPFKTRVMAGKKGIYVEYQNRDGNMQKGISYYSDQKGQFQRYNKLFIRLCNGDFSEKVDKNGKKLISLKHYSEVTVIGYID